MSSWDHQSGGVVVGGSGGGGGGRTRLKGGRIALSGLGHWTSFQDRRKGHCNLGRGHFITWGPEQRSFHTAKCAGKFFIASFRWQERGMEAERVVVNVALEKKNSLKD